MATLVQFLAAGVNGAANGTATFLLRGTASSAAAVLYNDFERTAQPGTNVITLDANGAAEVYCSAYVDVAIRNSAGTLLRTVTVGNSSGVVEVRSDSFTGTDYDGSPANTVNEPVTLTEVLNRWNDSAGTTNFQVLLDGVAVNLQSALASVGVGLFINVKDPAYGAEGDGVTDDTTAIEAAIADAGGAIVFFPPGVYNVEGLNLIDDDVHLMGSGCGSTTIRRTNAGNAVVDFAGVGAGTTQVIEGIHFESSATVNTMFNIDADQTLIVRDCSFDMTNNGPLYIDTDTVQLKLNITDCSFICERGPALENQSDVGISTIIIKGCHFELTADFQSASQNATISGCDVQVSDCVFDGSAVTIGDYWHIYPEEHAFGSPTTSISTGSVQGCRFIDGGSDGFVFRLDAISDDSSFVESDNIFSGYDDPTVVTDSGRIYDYENIAGINESSRVVLGSRTGKSLRFTNSGGISVTLSGHRIAETIVLSHTFAGDLSVLLESTVEMPPNAELQIAVFNNSGGARNVSFNGTGQTVTESAVPDGGMAFGKYKYFLETTNTMRVVVYASAQVAT